jgi:hypothetical protein
VLADRLGKLVDLGVLERRAYREEGTREREEYVLTPAGEELAPVLAALNQWGAQHLPSDLPPASRYVETGTGRPLHVAFVDDDGRTVDLAAVTILRNEAEESVAAPSPR